LYGVVITRLLNMLFVLVLRPLRDLGLREAR
jgi:hypothetical protein